MVVDIVGEILHDHLAHSSGVFGERRRRWRADVGRPHLTCVMGVGENPPVHELPSASHGYPPAAVPGETCHQCS
jgi:hypothetical protein